MYLCTYFVNETKKEYSNTGINSPEEISKNLLRFEDVYKWDLKYDNIYIWHTSIEKLINYRLLEV